MATLAYQRSIFRSSYNPLVGTTDATIWPKNTAYAFPVAASPTFNGWLIRNNIARG